MNKEIKAKWIAALRSGEFKQAQRALESAMGYCCLGVLCRIMELPRRVIDGAVYYNGSAVCLHRNTEVLIGLKMGETATLITMNDSEGKSFNEIADWIETNL